MMFALRAVSETISLSCVSSESLICMVSDDVDRRDSESLFQKRRGFSLIEDVDSAGTPVEHYAHIMAVYADKMPPNPVLHDNGLASVQRIISAME